jgi:hypothetical protein
MKPTRNESRAEAIRCAAIVAFLLSFLIFCPA